MMIVLKNRAMHSIFFLLSFLVVSAVPGLAQNQKVTLQFQQNLGNGLERVVNPTIGKPVLDPGLGASWALELGTTFQFKIETDKPYGQLVFELRETQPEAPRPYWIITGEPPPNYAPPTTYWSHSINLASATGVQTVQIPNTLSATTLGGDPDKVFYFGIYATGGQVSNVDAFFNGRQYGSGFSALYQYHPKLELPVLIHHPDWNPPKAIIDTENQSPEYEKFTNLGVSAHSKPVMGSIANYRYRLVDNDSAAQNLGIVARQWSFYKLNGTQLELVGHFPGVGSGALVGSFCDVIPPVPQCTGTVTCLCDETQRYVVQCRRINSRGAISGSEIDLNNLGPDTFIYEVGQDLTSLSPASFLISFEHGSTPTSTNHSNPVPLEGYTVSGVLHPYPLWLKPWGNNYGCWNAGQTAYKIRYRLSTQGSYTEAADWKVLSNTTNASLVDDHFQPVMGSATGGGMNESDFPIHVSWKIKTPYGETEWSEDELIKRDLGLQAPELQVEWPSDQTVLSAGSSFPLTLGTSEVQNGPPGVSYGGTYSVWLYDPEAPNERQVQLNNSAGETCQIDPLQTIQTNFWNIPTNLGWTPGLHDRVAIRVKHIWHPVTAGVDCDNGINALTIFSAIATGGMPDSVAGKADSGAYKTVVGPDSAIELMPTQTTPLVFDPSGGVNFGFDAFASGSSIPVKLSWRWSRSNGQVWRNHGWQPSSTGFSEIWPLSESGDGFANLWQWNAQLGMIEARYQTGSAATPFGPINGSSTLQTFFAGDPFRTMTVEVTAEFQDGSMASSSQAFQLRVSQNDALVQSLQMKAGAAQLVHYYGRVGALPDMEWTVQTTTSQNNLVQVGLFKANAGQSSWDELYCNTIESATGMFTSILNGSNAIGKTYTLKADAGSAFHSLFATHGPGTYEVRVSGEACGTSWQQGVTSSITLNPDQSFRLRFHYRDHLGSSTVSRAYSPSHATRIVGSDAFQFKLTGMSGNQQVALFAQETKTSHFTPFGKTMGNAEAEPNPRYTDHEYDGESGFNYMKGRYQLATWAKFNRPDPMRDWDWENPSSINLYQYVRNNPVMSWDPTGEAVQVVAGGVAAAGALVAAAVIASPKIRKAVLETMRTAVREHSNRQAEFDNFGEQLMNAKNNKKKPVEKRVLPPGLQGEVNFDSEPKTDRPEDDEDNGQTVHRIGGSKVKNLRLKENEKRLAIPGISVLVGGTPQSAAEQIKAAFPDATRLREDAKVVGSAFQKAIEDAGFKLLPKPSRKLPNHFRIIHPEGAKGFTDENLARLSKVFQDFRLEK